MKRRWNGIDRALLVLALCALTGGVWLGWKKPWRRTAGEVLVCTLRLPVQEAILQNVLAEPAVGDAVRIPADGVPVGEVLSVSRLPYRIPVVSAEGLQFADDAGRTVTEVTVRLILQGRMLGNRRLAAGDMADLILGERFAAGCEVVRMEVIGNAE